MSAGAGSVRVGLERPSMRRAAVLVEAVRRSRPLHGRWVQAPSTLEQYRAYLRRIRQPSHIGHFVCTEDGALAGVINIDEIVLGAFRSAYLGYYSLAPYHGRGLMREGLRVVIRLAFRTYGLHRLEANIQPDNVRSIELVRGLGFRREGFSPRYLKIASRWHDHERWALTIEDWAPA